VLGTDRLLTIDQLAAASGMTVRTLRSHASRGLLPPPIIDRRVGYYGPSHLARVSFIREMQEAGFSLSSIEQLLSGVPDDAGDAMLSVIRGLVAPWNAEPVALFDPDDVVALLGPDVTDEQLTALTELGDAEVTPEGQISVSAPGLLAAAAEGVAAGLPLDGIIAAGRLVMGSADAVAANFVQLFRDSVWKEFVDSGMPEEDWERISGIHQRLQPLAVQAFLSAFQRAMTQEVSEALGQELGAGAKDALDRLLGRPGISGLETA
jgi:DNA-binding transcriptional MerR regulator